MDIHDKIDKIDDKVTDLTVEVKSGFSTYNQSLIDHMRRTEIAEESISYLRNHVVQVTGILKFLKWFGLPSVVGSILAVLLKIYNII